MAFIRVADDAIYPDDNPKTEPTCITIFTAELKKRQFPALKVVPHQSLFAGSQYTQMKTNISALDERYTLQPYVLFGMAGGKKLYISGVQTSAKWAEDNWS